MSKYIKLEDALIICQPLSNYKIAIKEVLELLPTIKVSEDCISRADAINAYNEAVDELVKAEMEEFNLGDFTECSFNTTQLKLIARKIEDAPSVVVRNNRTTTEQPRWLESGLWLMMKAYCLRFINVHGVEKYTHIVLTTTVLTAERR